VNCRPGLPSVIPPHSHDCFSHTSRMTVITGILSTSRYRHIMYSFGSRFCMQLLITWPHVFCTLVVDRWPDPEAGYPLFCDFRIQGLSRTFLWQPRTFRKTFHIQHTASLHAVIFTLQQNHYPYLNRVAESRYFLVNNPSRVTLLPEFTVIRQKVQ